MPLSLEALRKMVNDGTIDTVAIGCVDMQGRIMGKRCTAHYFMHNYDKEIGINQCLFAFNIDGMPGDGYEFANWEMGWGNKCPLLVDMSTLRVTPWAEGTALAIGDYKDPITGEWLFCSPRSILRRQVERLAEHGLKGRFATELEFHLFNETQEAARQKHWQNLTTSHPYCQWANLQLSSESEPFMRKVRNALEKAGVPLEATHPEWACSQQEVNFVPAEPIEMADRCTLTKHAIREMAKQEGLAATFMAKYSTDKPGSSCHIHLSLEHLDSGKAAFHDPNDEFGMSTLMRQWTAGLVKYAPEYIYFFAPYINSYKRLQPNSFAPTKQCWAVENRTSAFRVCNPSTKGVHLEIRSGGADLNPYLAFSAIIAAGLAGIEEELELPPPAAGNLYGQKELPNLPHTLREAAEQMAQSKMLENALGLPIGFPVKNVIIGEKTMRHYLTSARLEIEAFEKQVTDWEKMCGFDRY